MDSGTTTIDTPVEHTLATVEAALSELITALRDGGLDHHDQTGLLGFLDRTEILRNQWQAVDAELLAACRDRGVADRECQRSMTKVLERRCLTTPTEAKRRMLAADAVGPRMTPTGVPLPRRRQEIGAAMTAGAITDRQVTLVDDTLRRLDEALVHPDIVKAVETELVAHCRRFGLKELKTIRQRYLDALDPDGPEPDQQRNHDRRAFKMHPTASGAVVGEFRLTPETGAKAQALFSSLANPRVDTAGGMATADLRSRDQRMHDALDDMFSRLLRVGGLPDSGGTPATVIVTIDHTDLLNDLNLNNTTGGPNGYPGFTVPFDTCPTCGQEAGPYTPTGPERRSAPTQPDPATSESEQTQPEPAISAQAEPELAEPESAEPEQTQPGSGMSERAERDPAMSEQAQLGLAGSEQAQPGTAMSEQAQLQPAMPERAQSEPAMSERAQPAPAASEQAQPEPAVSEPAVSERALPEPSRPGPAGAGRARSERIRSERTQPDPARPDPTTHAGPETIRTGHAGSRSTNGQLRNNPTQEPDQPLPPTHPPTPNPESGTSGRVRRSRPGRGTTSHGLSLTVRELLQLAGEAEIYPVVLTKHGVLLEMGRNRRIANKHQTLALIARDGGCSFPGCDRPPEWCERHHIVAWRDNGPTDFHNMTLLCSYHHRHFLNRGWQVQINLDGLPEWIPPRYLDPEQKPLINNRILAKIHQSPLIT